MKILYLIDSTLGDYNTLSRRLYKNIYNRLSSYCEIYTYGPKEHTINDSLISPIQYDKKIVFDDLIREFNPDIIVAIKYVLTYKWLKFNKNNISTIPFILIDGDYFSTPEDWIYEMGFDLIIQRGYIIDDFKLDIPNVWLPLSADEIDFYVDPDINREQKIVFIGSTTRFPYYNIRRNALELLENNDSFDSLEDIGFDKYPEVLRSYIGGFSCAGGSLHIPLGKTFEIMASGTALLTQWFHGSEELFGRNKCYFTYRDDLRDLEYRMNYMINNPEEVKYITKNALSIVNSKHLNMHRVLELYNIFKSIVEGKEIPRIWGR